MTRAAAFAIGAAAVVRLALAASPDSTRGFDTALTFQPLGGCGRLEFFDNLTPPALPPYWVAINAINPDDILWQTSNSGDPVPPANSLPNAAWINDPDHISDKYLDSPSGSDFGAFAILSFFHNYALEDGFDGGVLEVSVDFLPFQDILAAGGVFMTGGYNGTISTCCGNPLAGRQAWTGNSGGFIHTGVYLPFAQKDIAIRWRMASDSSGSGQGWRVDSVIIQCQQPTPTPTVPPPTPTPTSTPTASPTPRATPTPRVIPTPRVRPTPRTRL